jgi:AcrR family transcriptional regulator
MAPVKRSARRERAAATRQRILTAAYDLFATRGYTTTTMPEVADAAGVAVQTVYLVFRTKAALLEQVYAAAVLGADQVRPMDAEWFRHAITQSDPARSLAAVLDGILEIAARLAPLAATMETVGDEEVRAVHAEKESLRRALHRRYIEHLHQLDALSPDITVGQATDLLLGLASPTLYQQMVTDYGWPPGQWSAQLKDLLICSLLRPAVRPVAHLPDVTPPI